MANALYDHGRDSFLQGDIAWKNGGDIFKVTLVDSADYTLDLANDQYMNTNTISLAARIQTITMVVSNLGAGVADADDVLFLALTGDEAEYLIIWKDGGGSGETESGTTDLLIACIDTANGLPVTPAGIDNLIRWNESGIYKL